MVPNHSTPNNESWVQPDWTAIVDRILNDDETAERELCDNLSRGLRLLVARRLDECPEVDDVVNDVLATTVNNIRRGMLTEPTRLAGYVQSIAKHKVAHCICERVRSRTSDVSIEDVVVVDRRENPEESAISAERFQIVRATLNSLSSRAREILTRFYVDEQPPEQICAEMRLTETQFRLLKSRAKARFGMVGRRGIASAGLRRFVSRAVA